MNMHYELDLIIINFEFNSISHSILRIQIEYKPQMNMNHK